MVHKLGRATVTGELIALDCVASIRHIINARSGVREVEIASEAKAPANSSL